MKNKININIEHMANSLFTVEVSFSNSSCGCYWENVTSDWISSHMEELLDKLEEDGYFENYGKESLSL